MIRISRGVVFRSLAGLLAPLAALLSAPPAASPAAYHSTLIARDWLITPHDLAFDAAGNLLISANLDNRVAVVSPTGELLRYYELDDYQGAFQNTSVATTPSGRSWALNDVGLYELLPDGQALLITPLSRSRYGWMTHMCAGPGEVLYFTADRGQGVLFEIQLTPVASIRQIAALPARSFRALDLGPDGNLYALSSATGEIYRITPSGDVSLFQKGFSRNGGPYYIAFSPAGTLFVSDFIANRSMYEITLLGDITRRPEYYACTGSILFLPDGTMYGLDVYEPQLMRYDLNGGRQTLRAGVVGRQLSYLPSGGVLSRMSGGGHRVYFSSGVVSPSPLDPSLNTSASYLFDLEGNTYWFMNRRLFRADPGGAITTLADDLPQSFSGGAIQAAINYAERAIYAIARQDGALSILRFSLPDGARSEISRSSGPLISPAVAAAADGAVYLSYQTSGDYAYHVARIPPGGPATEVFRYPGREQGMILAACSRSDPRCYFILGPEPFRLREISPEGAVSEVVVDGDNVRAVDYQGLEITPGGDLWLVVPGQIFHLASALPASPPVPADFPTVAIAPGQSAEVAIPGDGLDGETAVQTSVPGVWVYQRMAEAGVLRFQLSAWPRTAPGEYDLVLHNAGHPPVVLDKKIRILPKP